MKKFNLKLLTQEQKNLRRRILEISHESHFSHIGSCFGSIDLINGVYKVKDKDEKFILSSGHAGIALYVILEKNGFIKNSHIKNFYIHPDRNPKLGIDVSTGSLGQGLPIALGMAISDRNKNVYCLVSDGECAEGSIWESLKIASDNNVTNLKIIINANGWSAYDTVNLDKLAKKIKAYEYRVLEVSGHDTAQIIKTLKAINEDSLSVVFAKTAVNQLPFLKGLDAHYCVMTDDNYNEAMDLLK